MQNRSEPYDPFIPNKHREGTNKTDQVQKQVDEVVGIMQENIDKIMQRGERIGDLEDKSRNMHDAAAVFHGGANKVRKRMWWKNFRWKIIIAVTILVILGIIIGSIVATQTTSP
ncbi:synaptobrevin-domain-containing protein [Mucor mucedo]|uniref:synaptobrevin-domain-containing protein n=1 Tax=Mucor mucedo TaxID=29922 RepID=UPI00221E91FA|nr:synaptobrevin-domain-containing protein [Mucor mucedo]KAI7895691.1 synaptobrevin-domain-containing protein [Mucor mucedo]